MDSGAPTPETDDDDELGSMAGVMAALARTDGLAVIVPGMVIAGQYVVEDKLGAGGMGVVYRARDRRLARAVAVKIGRAMSADGLRRVEREAMALARLSHPNVVAVHQVGELGGRVFIVMEHVAGGTARSWLAARPRTWREIVELYLGAGDGLAAAHATGLVHRDFKPDNVLVGDDGRARVADFGLARLADDAVAIDPSRPLAGVATEEGAVQGTPAYMPPEQLAGAAVDARADQFAFAASLWEALFGARPFAGRTPAEVRRAIEADTPRVAVGRAVPRAIVDAIRRGLAPKRDDRWPDVAAMLAALRRAREQRKRRLVGAGVVLAVAGVAAAIAIARQGAAVDPCTDGPRQIARVWSPARAARIAAQVSPAAWAPLAAQLDAYATRWAIDHRDACRATRVERSATEAMLDRRDVCMSRLTSALDATLARLEQGPPAVRARAAELIGGLPDAAGCTAGALGAEEPPPTDAAHRRVLEEAIAALAEADVGARAWLDPDAAAKADRALALARRAAWRPEIARALIAVATARTSRYDHAGAAVALAEASELAIAGHSDATSATALAERAWNLAELHRPGEAAQAIELARAFDQRGDDREVHLAVLTATAHVERIAEHFDAAIAAAHERVAVCDAGCGATARGLARMDLVDVLLVAHRFADAVEPANAALALFTAELGPDAADAGLALADLAIARSRLGEVDAAETAGQRALAILERALGPDDPALRDPLEVLGDLARGRGDRAQAGAHWSRALAIAERDGGGGTQAAGDLVNLAVLDLEGGDTLRGVERLERALAAFEAAVGPDSGVLVDALVALGYGERALGRLDAARAHHERAVAIARARFAPSAPNAINAQIELGNTLIAAGDPVSARALLEPLVALADAHAAELPPTQPAELRATLAAAQAATRRRAR